MCLADHIRTLQTESMYQHVPIMTSNFSLKLVEDKQQRVEVGVVKSAHLDRSLEKERESTRLLTQEKELLKARLHSFDMYFTLGNAFSFVGGASM